MEPSWLTALKQIHALAGSGLAFHQEDFDAERYQDIQRLCETLIAQTTSMPLELIQRAMGPFDGQYVTPKSVVRVAVFQQKSVLLVKEKSDGKWALPGGYADVGLSALENVHKELFEEAGIRIPAPRLTAVRHKAKGPYESDVRDFYIFLFAVALDTDVNPLPGMETSEVGFFPFDGLPPLSAGRTHRRDIDDAWRSLTMPAGDIIVD